MPLLVNLVKCKEIWMTISCINYQPDNAVIYGVISLIFPKGYSTDCSVATVDQSYSTFLYVSSTEPQSPTGVQICCNAQSPNTPPPPLLIGE
jgi:hypothetical protein